MENKKVTLAELGLETYEILEVHRSKIVSLPYNPRTITECAKRRLKAGIKRHGLVNPIVWNKRTGNNVGGNQRLSAIDTLAGTSDYTLHVAAIDVDDVRERELAILLNNLESQGEWNLDGLKGIVLSPGFDLVSAGFEKSDMFRLFGNSVIDDLKDGAELEELAEKVRSFASLYDKVLESNQSKNNVDYFAIFVFASYEDRKLFFEQAGLDDNRYQSGIDLRRLCKFN